MNIPRMLCLVGALTAFIFGMRSHSQQQKNTILQERIQHREQTLSDIRHRLREEREKLEQAEQRAKEALEGLNEELQAAKNAEDAWRKRFLNMPQGCRSAIEYLDTACPALQNY